MEDLATIEVVGVDLLPTQKPAAQRKAEVPFSLLDNGGETIGQVGTTIVVRNNVQPDFDDVVAMACKDLAIRLRELADQLGGAS